MRERRAHVDALERLEVNLGVGVGDEIRVLAEIRVRQRAHHRRFAAVGRRRQVVRAKVRDERRVGARVVHNRQLCMCGKSFYFTSRILLLFSYVLRNRVSQAVADLEQLRRQQ